MHLVQGTQKQHENLSRPSDSWVIDLKKTMYGLTHNLKTAWPTKISMLFLSSLDNLL